MISNTENTASVYINTLQYLCINQFIVQITWPHAINPLYVLILVTFKYIAGYYTYIHSSKAASCSIELESKKDCVFFYLYIKIITSNWIEMWFIRKKSQLFIVVRGECVCIVWLGYNNSWYSFLFRCFFFVLNININMLYLHLIEFCLRPFMVARHLFDGQLEKY